MGKHLAFGGVIAATAAIAFTVTSCSVNAKNDPTSSPSATKTIEPPRHPTPENTVTTTVTITQTPSPTRSMTDSPPRVNPATATTYYVDSSGDSGTAGSFSTSCEASLIPVVVPDAGVDSLKSAMTSLFSHRVATIGQSGLHNPLYLSVLEYTKSSVNGSTVNVWLTGKIRSPGECADQQIIDQLQHTAETSAGVKDANVYVNNQLVQNVISLKG